MVQISYDTPSRSPGSKAVGQDIYGTQFWIWIRLAPNRDIIQYCSIGPKIQGAAQENEPRAMAGKTIPHGPIPIQQHRQTE